MSDAGLRLACAYVLGFEIPYSMLLSVTGDWEKPAE